MRRFVVVLAGFGLVLMSLTGAGYVYFRGQIPPIQFQSERIVLRADPGIAFQPSLAELRTATRRFERLAGAQADLPPLEVAIIDDPKQMNAVALYVAIRHAIGTPAGRLPLPYPTPRLVSLLVGEPESAAELVTGRRSLGHEAGHWLLRVFHSHRPGRHDRPPDLKLPGWLEEGIAGYCEPTENRLGALLRTRAALADSAGAKALDLEGLLRAEPPEASQPVWAHPDLRMKGPGFGEAENYYALALLLVEYLETVHPSTVSTWLLKGSAPEEIEGDPLLHNADAFRTWIVTVPPLTL